ncbi:1-acyl-sn-glycerol-3-phosphate acyltransferase [Christensenellaceae bacterium OttesenSCG-928-K19]|nr:1-acyl-sn-glycerol-3-phosphate acyltransferase [Christensenellaceae bacterium OttesenSCG-928-K19]
MQENEQNKRNSEDEPELGALATKRKRKGPAERMWAPIKLHLDENYHYVSKNWGLRFLYYFAIFVGMPFVYLYYKIRWRFKVEGKANVKLVKKQAAITVANHVHNMDSFMLTYPFYPNTPYFVALKHNFEAFLVGGLVRVMRGIPLPEDMKNFERFTTQVSDTLQNTKRKIHLFPEGEIAPYSRELRPFKNGAFHLAVRNSVPVLPMVFVFPAKKRVTLIVGKPVCVQDVPGTEGLSEPKQVAMYSKYVKDVMQKMLDDYYIPRGIDAKENAR